MRHDPFTATEDATARNPFERGDRDDRPRREPSGDEFLVARMTEMKEWKAYQRLLDGYAVGVKRRVLHESARDAGVDHFKDVGALATFELALTLPQRCLDKVKRHQDKEAS